MIHSFRNQGTEDIFQGKLLSQDIDFMIVFVVDDRYRDWRELGEGDSPAERLRQRRSAVLADLAGYFSGQKPLRQLHMMRWTGPVNPELPGDTPPSYQRGYGLAMVKP